MAKHGSGVGEVTHQSCLNGKLDDDGGEACDVRFEWGETDSYGHYTPWRSGKVTDDTFSHIIKGLKGRTTYHYRAQAKNSAGTSNGSDMTFTTG